MAAFGEGGMDVVEVIEEIVGVDGEGGGEAVGGVESGGEVVAGAEAAVLVVDEDGVILVAVVEDEGGDGGGVILELELQAVGVDGASLIEGGSFGEDHAIAEFEGLASDDGGEALVAEESSDFEVCVVEEDLLGEFPGGGAIVVGVRGGGGDVMEACGESEVEREVLAEVEGAPESGADAEVLLGEVGVGGGVGADDGAVEALPAGTEVAAVAEADIVVELELQLLAGAETHGHQQKRRHEGQKVFHAFPFCCLFSASLRSAFFFSRHFFSASLRSAGFSLVTLVTFAPPRCARRNSVAPLTRRRRGLRPLP